MALSTLATIGLGLGSAALGSAISARGARDAAGAYQSGTEAGVAEQRRQFDTVQRLLAPQLATGNQARARAASLLGLNPVGAPMTADGVLRVAGQGNNRLSNMSNILNTLEHAGFFEPGVARPTNFISALLQNEAGQSGTAGTTSTGENDIYAPFEGSPGFQFITDQARRQTEASAAARGGLFSGGTGAAIAERISNLASLDFNNEINRLMALANGTQAATTQLTSGALNTGANVGNLLAQGGAARASGILGQANSIGGALNSFGQNMGLYHILTGGGFGGGGQAGGKTYNGGRGGF